MVILVAVLLFIVHCTRETHSTKNPCLSTGGVNVTLKELTGTWYAIVYTNEIGAQQRCWYEEYDHDEVQPRKGHIYLHALPLDLNKTKEVEPTNVTIHELRNPPVFRVTSRDQDSGISASLYMKILEYNKESFSAMRCPDAFLIWYPKETFIAFYKDRKVLHTKARLMYENAIKKYNISRVKLNDVDQENC